VTRNKVGAPGLQAVPSTRTHTLVFRAHSLAKLGAGGDPSEDRRSVTTVLALLDALDRIRRSALNASANMPKQQTPQDDPPLSSLLIPHGPCMHMHVQQ